MDASTESCEPVSVPEDAALPPGSLACDHFEDVLRERELFSFDKPQGRLISHQVISFNTTEADRHGPPEIIKACGDSISFTARRQVIALGDPIEHYIPVCSATDTYDDDSVMSKIHTVADCLDVNKVRVLQGPTSAGKSFTIMRYCAMTRSPMLRLNMDSETKMDQLLGFVYVDGIFKIKADGPLVQAMREGLVLFIDEGNTTAEKVLGPLVQAIRQGVVVVALGGMSFGQEGAQYGFERVRLHPNFRLVITQNPANYGQRPDWYANTLSIAVIETFDSVPREVICKSTMTLVQIANEVTKIREKSGCSVPLTARDLIHAKSVFRRIKTEPAKTRVILDHVFSQHLSQESQCAVSQRIRRLLSQESQCTVSSYIRRLLK
jgi:hypothetical protein